MIRANIPLAREGKHLIMVLKQPELIRPGVNMMVDTFFTSCPLILGIPLLRDDLQTLIEESAHISIKEHLLLATIDPESEKIIAMSLSLSKKGKKIQGEVFSKLKWKEERTMNIMFDLFDKISVPYDDYPDPIYGFGLAVSPELTNNKIGTTLYSTGMTYWKNLGFKSRFTETSNKRSHSIVEKFGGITVKSYNYDDYEKDSGFKMKDISKGEIIAHQKTML